ncbi:MAG: hypothetical protein EZS28_044979 [Streblomastix strix]|uniref:Uncharacterized protein n=1 Tax=Streblomastix strix TaxID=222440 RepID=A0A5J4TNT3_9EUKA|nr:MAG: hypothetical protein EZS28_044979 [Streblomastix strix]
MDPARNNLCLAENEQLSSSTQEQSPSAYDEDRKTLLVLAFMPKPEIKAFLADQSFVPRIFEKDNRRFIEKLDAFKFYMLSKQIAFEDLILRFLTMNNTFSKTETQQKITYVQVTNSQEEQVRFLMEHSPRAQLIANSKPEQPLALLPRPSAQPSSTASSINNQNQNFHSRKKKKRKQTERSLSESSSSTSSSRSTRLHRTHSRRSKRSKHSASASISSRSTCSRSPLSLQLLRLQQCDALSRVDVAQAGPDLQLLDA